MMFKRTKGRVDDCHTNEMEECVLSQEFRQPGGQVHYFRSPGFVEEGDEGVSLKGEKSIDRGVKLLID